MLVEKLEQWSEWLVALLVGFFCGIIASFFVGCGGAEAAPPPRAVEVFVHNCTNMTGPETVKSWNWAAARYNNVGFRPIWHYDESCPNFTHVEDWNYAGKRLEEARNDARKKYGCQNGRVDAYLLPPLRDSSGSPLFGGLAYQRCTRRTCGVGLAHIGRTRWNGADAAAVSGLVQAHELGHAGYNMSHVDLNPPIPNVMHSAAGQFIDSYDLQFHWLSVDDAVRCQKGLDVKSKRCRRRQCRKAISDVVRVDGPWY